MILTNTTTSLITSILEWQPQTFHCIIILLPTQSAPDRLFGIWHLSYRNSSAWNFKSVKFLRLQKMQHNILKCAGTRVNAITTTTTQTERLSLALALPRLELRTQLDLQILEEDISQRTPSLFHNIWLEEKTSHRSLFLIETKTVHSKRF